MLTLIQTCKLSDVDPQAWLADVLARIARSQEQRSRRAIALSARDEIEGHKDAIAVDAIAPPVADASSFDLKAKSFVEGTSRIVVVENR